MKQTSKILIVTALILSMSITIYAMACMGCWISLNMYDGGFSRSIPSKERQQRLDTVTAARRWLGTEEYSDRHLQLLDIYNSHEPLARNYAVTPNDSWCAAFVSAVAIEQKITGIVPTECGCERQIELWKSINKWEETDHYLPLPGDFIYYNWDESFSLKDNVGWSDHVGIVVGTAGPLIKVIEGNKDNCVGYRIIFRGDYRIRGFGLPDYQSVAP